MMGGACCGGRLPIGQFGLDDVSGVVDLDRLIIRPPPRYSLDDVGDALCIFPGLV